MLLKWFERIARRLRENYSEKSIKSENSYSSQILLPSVMIMIIVMYLARELFNILLCFAHSLCKLDIYLFCLYPVLHAYPVLYALSSLFNFFVCFSFHSLYSISSDSIRFHGIQLTFDDRERRGCYYAYNLNYAWPPHTPCFQWCMCQTNVLLFSVWLSQIHPFVNIIRITSEFWVHIKIKLTFL